jgi:hypothetical protein
MCNHASHWNVDDHSGACEGKGSAHPQRLRGFHPRPYQVKRASLGFLMRTDALLSLAPQQSNSRESKEK